MWQHLAVGLRAECGLQWVEMPLVERFVVPVLVSHPCRGRRRVWKRNNCPADISVCTFTMGETNIYTNYYTVLVTSGSAGGQKPGQ